MSSLGLAHSYFVFQHWLNLVTDQMGSSAAPSTTKIKEHAHILRVSTAEFSIRYGDKGPLPDAMARCLIIIEKTTKALIHNPIEETELKAADLALRLITPLHRGLLSLERSPVQLEYTVRQHEERVETVTKLGDRVLGQLSRIAESNSPLVTLITETIPLALTDIHIESLRTSRIILVSQHFSTISKALDDLESFYALNPLTDPDNMIQALQKLSHIQSLCSELDEEVRDLGPAIENEYNSIIEKKDLLKFQIFQKYLHSRHALLPLLTQVSYSKDLSLISTTLLKLSSIINCVGSFKVRCAHIFGKYDGPEEIDQLHNAVNLRTDTHFNRPTLI